MASEKMVPTALGCAHFCLYPLTAAAAATNYVVLIVYSLLLGAQEFLAFFMPGTFCSPHLRKCFFAYLFLVSLSFEEFCRSPQIC